MYPCLLCQDSISLLCMRRESVGKRGASPFSNIFLTFYCDWQIIYFSLPLLPESVIRIERKECTNEKVPESVPPAQSGQSYFEA